MSVTPECWAIIPAAGIGQRMASSIPKQYLNIGGKTILEHAAQPLLDNTHIKRVVFALHVDDDQFSQLAFQDNSPKIRKAIGGETRAHSVLNALEAIKNEIKPNDFVLVHDAARPCLSNADLTKLIDACLLHEVGGILAVRATDTIKQIQQHEISCTLDRDNIWRAFTPQMFKFKILYDAIKQALQNNITITDEASAVESMNFHPCVVEGSSRNIKVTCPDDIAIAEMYLTSNE